MACEAEVLGAVFIDNNIFKDIVDILSPEDFYNTNHGLIFDVMKRLQCQDIVNLYIIDISEALGKFLSKTEKHLGD